MIIKSLDDKTLCTLLIDYVNHDKTNQAVLIDGDWGSGKTFFIQEVFLKEYEAEKNNANSCKSRILNIDSISDSQERLYKVCGSIRNVSRESSDIAPKVNPNICNNSIPNYKRDIYYVSLYGLNNFAQIDGAIFEKMIATHMPDKQSDSALKLMKIIGKMIPSAFQYFGFVINSGLFKDVIGLIKPIKDIAIVFDDLERCNIELNSILGYINNLVEHCNVKAIILANEKEIWRANFTVNIAEKYNVALKHLEMLHSCANGETVPGIKDSTVIHKHAEEIFSQDNGYDRVKEKLIWLNLKYQKPLSEPYDSVLSHYVDDKDAKDVLEKYRELVLTQFNELDNTNVRVLICVFLNFQRLFRMLCTIETEQKDLLTEIEIRMLNYLTYCTIITKKGDKLELWEDDEVFSRHLVYSDDKKQKRFIYGYKWINKLVTDGCVDEEAFKRELQNHLVSEGGIKEYSSFINASAWQALVNWKLLEDEEVYKYLEQLKDELRSKKYNSTEFDQIVLVLAQLEVNGFKIQYEEYINLIIDNLKEIELDSITIANFSKYRGDSNVIMHYREAMEPIIEQIEKGLNKKKLDIYTYLNTCQWDEEYVQHCINNKERFLEDKKFFALLELSKFEKHLHSATAREVHFLLNAIQAVYNFDNLNEWFKADADNLNELIQITEEYANETDKLTLRANLLELVVVMKGYLKRL